METNRLSENSIVLKNAWLASERYITLLDIRDFEMMFGIQIVYLDMSLKENENKKPNELAVCLNVDNGDIVYDSENRNVTITGEYRFIDGLKKFEIMQFHPDSKVLISVSLFSEDEVIKYLSQLNSVRNSKDEI